MESAARAVCDYHLKLEAVPFAGPFARWVSIVYTGTDGEPEARAVLSDMEEHLDDYDVMDRLEILCAISRLDRTNAYKYGNRIAAMLQALPKCTETHLRALGMNMGV